MGKREMSKRRLEQYIDLKKEIFLLGEQILSATSGGDIVTDMVRGSSAEHPYTQHNIIIQGHGSVSVQRWSARKTALEHECTAVEEFIESVDDSTMRQILTWKYIQGNTVERTAAIVGYSPVHVKRLLKNFFEKMIPNDTK